MTGPFVVVGEMRGLKRVAPTPDGRRLLLFDDGVHAMSFADGVADVAGIVQAIVADFGRRRRRDRRRARPAPRRTAVHVRDRVDRWARSAQLADVAYAYRLIAGARMVVTSRFVNPN